MKKMDGSKVVRDSRYKNITEFHKESNRNNVGGRSKHSCPCPTCLVVGMDLLQRKYTDFNNILLEEDSKLIFNPLFERCQN